MNRLRKLAFGAVLSLAACSSPPATGSGDAAISPSSDATVGTSDAAILGDGSVPDGGSTQADTGPTIAPWVVFSVADPTTPMTANLLKNPGMETANGATLYLNWNAFQGGYQPAPGEGHSGANGLKLVRATGDTNAYGAYQSVTLNQTAARPIYFSGWSRADSVTGDPDSDCDIYIDIAYVTQTQDPVNGCDNSAGDPCALYGRVPSPGFDTGTHDWQLRDGFAMPAYPIKSLSFYVLLRGGHHGTVWFDDLQLSEVTASVLSFDGRIVAAARPATPFTGGQAIDLVEDGLSVSLWSEGGAMKAATLDGTGILDGAFDFTSDFFVHEADTKEWLAPGGHVAQDVTGAVQTASMGSLEMDFKATWTVEADRLRVKAELHSTSARDRALTLYWAVPAIIAGGFWGEDVRRYQPLAGADELSNTTAFWYEKLGATGEFSRYPLATVFGGQSGIAVGHPLDQPRIARLAYQPLTHQLYLAFDVGLSSATTKFPNTATCELVLYRTRHTSAQFGFRSALKGFYDRFPDHFARRIPAAKEGIWVAFPNLSAMVHGAGESIDDFNIGFDELGSLSYVAFDDAHGIQSFRYLIEPASTWMQITDNAVDPNNAVQVKAYLDAQYASTGAAKKAAEKTLSSGIFGADGNLFYDPFTDGPPWCPGKCALFYLSADPDISISPYTVNQANYAWNASTLATYTTTPGLDGEYLDSFVMEATRANYRTEHLAFVDTPPTFALAAPHKVVTPIIFSTVEFAHWLKPQIPAGKYFIANAMLIGVPWGADLFDFMGEEVNWVKDVGGGVYQIVPEDDQLLIYRRSLSRQRPYGFLMNTDFTNMSNALVERYMRVCLFYGIYPSMFSANASQGNYFENQALYGRDRALFKKYVPMIRDLNTAGWEPMTAALAAPETVYLERFGNWPGSLYFTLRNPTDAAVTVTVTLDRTSLGIAAGATVKSLLLGTADVSLSAAQSSFSVTLPPQETEELRLVP